MEPTPRIRTSPGTSLLHLRTIKSYTHITYSTNENLTFEIPFRFN